MIDHPHRDIRRLLAPNPSAMTGPGTNGYIVGTGEVAVIDPGPEDDGHLSAWLDALAGERVRCILVTHAHLDHSGLAPRLADAVSAPIIGYGRHDAGRSATMARLARDGLIAGGEGVDSTFAPDETVTDGDTLTGPGWRIDVLHTPGHFAGHLSFAVADVIMTGDHVLGWTSTLISPPDGDLASFLATSARLRQSGARAFLPGHGDPLTDPVARLDWLIRHRQEREAQIRTALASGLESIEEIVRHLYTDTPQALWPAAARNVLAHLIALVGDDEIDAEPAPGLMARYRLRKLSKDAGRAPPPLL